MSTHFHLVVETPQPNLVAGWRKGDPQKVELASALRASTTMTLKWIAQRFNMGAWTCVSNCLVEQRRKERKCK